MKIAIVLNTSWNIYNFRLNFVKALLRQGHEVHAIAPVDEYSYSLIREGCEFHPVEMDSRGANPLKDLSLTIELTSIYKRVRPDIILHYTIKPNIYGTLAATLLGIPVINNVCGLGTVFLKKGFASRVAKWLYKIAFRFPKKVFFQNEEDLKLFIDTNLISAKRADLLPGSGIDLSLFTPSPVRKSPVFSFLMVSRIIRDKGVMEYIEAIRILKARGFKARFQLLGAMDPEHKSGISVDIVESWIKDDLVDYLGRTDDVRPYVNQAHCIVLPSYREGSPRSLMEAAALARPIIATDVPGCRQVVEEGVNGWLCKSHNAEDLAATMIHMMCLPEEERERMGKLGREKMEREFSDTIILKKYLQAMQEIKPSMQQEAEEVLQFS